MNWTATLWLLLMVGFLAAEAATVTMVSLWFAAGALSAMVVCLLGGSLGLQAGIFLAVSVLLLLALRPLVRKFVTPRVTATNVDALIGAKGTVTASIDNLSAQGQVKLGGMTWTARSQEGTPIPEGTTVKVERIEGVKVYVSPVREAAQV